MVELEARAAGVWIEPDGPEFMVWQHPALDGEQPARFATREQAEGAAQVIAAAESCSIYFGGSRGRQTLQSGAV